LNTGRPPNQNFIGIKLGDVNGSRDPNTSVATSPAPACRKCGTDRDVERHPFIQRAKSPSEDLTHRGRRGKNLETGNGTQRGAYLKGFWI